MMPSANHESAALIPEQAAISKTAGSADDPRVIVAMEEYSAALRAGRRLDRNAFLAAHADIAEPLAKCLDGLEFVCTAAPRLGRSGEPESDARDELRPSAALGDYRIVREIGRGGMGIVYEAVQISLGRRVALKVLPFAAAMDPKQLHRFKNEAQAAAHLHHTNIVPVYAVGCERGVHFYAMQFIEGQTVAALIRELRQLAGIGTADSSTALAPANALASELLSGRWAPAKQKNGEVVGLCGREEPSGQYLSTPAPQNRVTPPADATPRVGLLSTDHSANSRAYFRTVAHLGVQAAEALEHAHAKAVIHRDIKPANLLIDASGNLWITDFGLARLLSEAGLTMTGDLVGTLRYMSPEQALAKRVPVDHRSDIYSLGVTLYELLTLRPAYDGRDRQEVMQQIAFQEPRLPRRINKSIPTEIETIVRKAMGKNPAERYATAQELADDLRRFLDDKPIHARRVGQLERFWRWCRRNPVIAGLAAAAAVFLLAGTTISSYFAIRAEQRAREALQEKARADQHLYVAHMNLAQVAWESGHLSRVQELLNVYRNPQPDWPDLRGWEWYYQERLCRDELRTLTGHKNSVVNVIFGRQGTRLASTETDGTVMVWDIANGVELCTLKGQTVPVNGLAFSPDGARLATGGIDGTVRISDASNGQELRVLRGHRTGVGSLAFSPDGTRLNSVALDGTVIEWDAVNRQELRQLKMNTAIVRNVALSPDGLRLASAGFDGTVKLWDARSGQELHDLKAHTATVWGVAFSADGSRLATAGEDHTVRVWDTTSGRSIHTLQGHTMQVNGVAFSPDGARLVSAGSDSTIKVWETTSGQELRTLRGHAGSVRNVAFSPDGIRLASAGSDRTIKLWQPLSRQEPRTLEGNAPQHGRSLPGPNARGVTGAAIVPASISAPSGSNFVTGICGVIFSPDGSRLASADTESIINIWDASSGQMLRTLGFKGVQGQLKSNMSPWQDQLKPLDIVGSKILQRGHLHLFLERPQLTPHEYRSGEAVQGRFIVDLAFSPDGTRLAAGAPGLVRIWNAATGQETPPIRGTWEEGASVAFGPDGGQILAAASNGGLKIWETVSGKEVRTVQADSEFLLSVALSRDRTRLALGGYNGMVAVVDAASGRKLYTLGGHTDKVRCVAFTTDGTRLCSAGDDGTVILWDISTAQRVHTLRGHTDKVTCVAFSPGGMRLASGSDDKTVKIWDVTTGQELRTLKGYQGSVMSVAFSPDGARLASGSSDMTVRVWDARPITPEVQEEREAVERVRLLFASRSGRTAEVVEELGRDRTISETVRQRAIALADVYRKSFVHRQAYRLVDSLFAELLLKREVLESIRKNDALTEEVRQETIVLVESPFDAGTSRWWDRWQIARKPGADAALYRRALLAAEQASRLYPDDVLVLHVLGAAQYRVGLYQQAVDTLSRCVKRYGATFLAPSNLGLLAMSHYCLGQKEQAQDYLSRLRQYIERTPNDEEGPAFLGEVEALLQGKTDKAKE
jgi:WD40 repeat protein/serine/threonine protein kinase